MPVFPHRETGEAVEIPDDVLEAYVDLIRFAEEAEEEAAIHRTAARERQDLAQKWDTDARRYLQQAAELVPRDVAIPVGDAVTYRVPGKAGARSVRQAGIEKWREHLPPECLPRQVVKEKAVTVADIDKHRPAIDRAGIPITDLLDIPEPSADVVKVAYPKEA